MSIQKKNTVYELRLSVEKDQLTYNQSYKWLSGTSIDSLVNAEELFLCMLGACIKRIVNWAVSACREHPHTPILASKFDFKPAFRLCHLNAATAIQTCTQLVEIGLLLMMLQLFFGGKPCPSEWGTILESICDLANAILHSDYWDPDKIFVPNQHLVPNWTLLDNNIPSG